MSKKIKYGSYHFHSENSLQDSPSRIPDLVKKFGEYGAPAIGLTDHGNLLGAFDLLAEVEKYNKENGTNMVAIPGVEVYCKLESDLSQREHLVLLPKNRKGFSAIGKFVTKTNSNIQNGFPIATWDMLEKYFKFGDGHGNVIASSACMAGVISVVLLKNYFKNKEIEKIEKKIRKKKETTAYNPEKIKKLTIQLQNLEQELADKKAELQDTTKLSKKAYKARLSKVEKIKGSANYQSEMEALEKEIKNSEEAKEKIPCLQKTIAELNARIKKFKDPLKAYKATQDVIDEYAEQIKAIEDSKVSDEELIKEAKEKTMKFVEIFGKDNFFFEIQYHGIPEEKIAFPLILKLAKEMNIPFVATNDAHAVSNTEDELYKMQLVRSMRFNVWNELSDSDKELYIKTDDEMIEKLSEIISKEDATKAVENIGLVLSQCKIEPDATHHYPKFIPEREGESSEECIRRKCYENISWRFPNKKDFTKEYQDRLEYELDVICKMGYADYHLIVQDFLEYGRLVGKIDLSNPPKEFLKNPFDIENLRKITKEGIGTGIGPGRGSAVGSLVCYLLGITGVDPLKYNLLFERFLNVERVSMPDIDSDFEPVVRGYAVDYVKYKYGEKAVCSIATKGSQAAKASIRTAARLLSSKIAGETTYLSRIADILAKAVPAAPGTKLNECDEILTKTCEQFSGDDYKHAREIIRSAKILEGIFFAVGTHAAGIVLSDNGDVSAYLPLLFNETKNLWCCQCVKEQVEEQGLLKFDFLGLRNLGIITNTQRLIYQRYRKKINTENLYMNDKKVFENIYSKAATNSVFQFESSGMKQMLKQFQPESIEDIILLVAAYRPGPMQYLKDIIAVKRKEKEPEYIIPEMESILGATYGKPIYQEQIMAIFNQFAGFSLGEADIIRRYMSKKKTDKFMAYKEKFIEGIVAKGATKANAEAFWEELLKFSQYAFNKSHAAVYAFVSYYTAYLKYYYPKEYLCSVLNSDIDLTKKGEVISDCRDLGIKVLPPDINKSGYNFTVGEDSIMFGLSMVKNVSQSANVIINEREINGPYKSFGDFIARTHIDSETSTFLIRSGAFDAFTNSRSALESVISDFVAAGKKYEATRKKIKELEASIYALSHPNEFQIYPTGEKNRTIFKKGDQEFLFKCACTEIAIEKKLKQQQASLSNARETQQSALDLLHSISYDKNAREDIDIRLNNEKEATSSFISAHPLNGFVVPRYCKPIETVTIGQTSICGVITNLAIRQRKSDKADMAFFTLEDANAKRIDINVFTKTYELYKDLIKDGAVVIISGTVHEDSFGDEVVLKLSAENIKIPEKILKKICVKVPSLAEWSENIYNEVKYYNDATGYELYLFDESTGTFRETDLSVSYSILNNENISAFEF